MVAPTDQRAAITCSKAGERKIVSVAVHGVKNLKTGLALRIELHPLCTTHGGSSEVGKRWHDYNRVIACRARSQAVPRVGGVTPIWPDDRQPTTGSGSTPRTNRLSAISTPQELPLFDSRGTIHS